MNSPFRDEVFISYSHRNRSWLSTIKAALEPYLQDTAVTHWDDTEILPGARWQTEIERAIASASVALLLVSQEYLQSEFIRNIELPALIQAEEKQGLILLWVPIGASPFQDTVIGRYQAIQDPQTPLDAVNDDQLTHALQRIGHAVRRAVQQRRNVHLPQARLFIGRERELKQLKLLVKESRVVTLVGSGGCGKTSLAIQLAREIQAEYPDGNWFLQLAQVSEPSLVAQEIRRQLGVESHPDETALSRIVGFLSGKRSLLILDNCEHLSPAPAEFVDAVSAACPDLKVVATSREFLGAESEHEFRVPSLSLPIDLDGAAASEAVKLFVHTRRFHQQDFRLNDENKEAIVRICRSVNGIPLAIELACSRARTMSLDDLADRLDQKMLGILTGGRRAGPSRRHQTMRAAIEWSYDLLTRQEQVLFARASLFAGGWSLAAAEHVCSDKPDAAAGAPVTDDLVSDLLSSLVNQSLVVFDADVGRYSFLEIIRQFSAEKFESFDDWRPWRDRHLEYYLERAEIAEVKVLGPEQATWLDRLERDHSNLLRALQWCHEQEDESYAQKGLRLAGQLWYFWDSRGFGPIGRIELNKSLNRPGANQPTLPRAKVLNALAFMAFRQGDYATAHTHSQESLQIRRALNDRGGIARSLTMLGNVAHEQADYAAAKRHFEEAISIHREIGDRVWEAGNLGNLVRVAIEVGDLETAETLSAQGRMINQQLQNRAWEAIDVQHQAFVAMERGDLERACSLQKECLEMTFSLRHKLGIAEALVGAGCLAVQMGRFEEALCFLEATQKLRKEIGAPLRRTERVRYDRCRQVAEEQLDAALILSACNRAQALTPEQSVEAALALLDSLH